MPLFVISPYAKKNFVDHTVTDQSSILRFVEDNWATGRIGNYSFDEKAGTLTNLLAFAGHHGNDPETKKAFVLDPATGAPVESSPATLPPSQRACSSTKFARMRCG